MIVLPCALGADPACQVASATLASGFFIFIPRFKILKFSRF